jgi:hypothetical protein
MPTQALSFRVLLQSTERLVRVYDGHVRSTCHCCQPRERCNTCETAV